MKLLSGWLPGTGIAADYGLCRGLSCPKSFLPDFLKTEKFLKYFFYGVARAGARLGSPTMPTVVSFP